jgi:dienelactone hydrolase
MKKETEEDKSVSITLVILFLFFTFSISVLYINRARSYYYYERISFKSAGSTLYANIYYPSKNIDFQDKHPLIIYAPGFGSQRDIDLRITIELTKRGFFVAALDYHGLGESEGRLTDIDPDTNIPAVAQDCSKLLDILEKRGVYQKHIDKDQIGLIGHSMGGMVVLQNQVLDDRFKATVAWAPVVSFEGFRTNRGEIFEDYLPKNLLNENNSENLLIIHHVHDEVVDFEDNAELAQELTACKLIKITDSFGSPHQLISEKVIKKSINWFEKFFFDSETKNGPINISYIFNYILIVISLIALVSTVFYFLSYVSKYFELKKDIKTGPTMRILKKRSKKKIIIQIIKIPIYYYVFLITWFFLRGLFGIIGLFYVSIIIIFSYLLIKVAIYMIKEREKFNLSNLLKLQYNEGELVYIILCTGIFLGLYLAFSIVYPFNFVYSLCFSFSSTFCILTFVLSALKNQKLS